MQREIMENTLLEVSYVGTRTNRLISMINLNQSFPGPGPQGPRRTYCAKNPDLVNLTYRTNYGAAKYHCLAGALTAEARTMQLAWKLYS